MTTRDHILGWLHAAQLIADSMPAPVKPCPPRLVPVTERIGAADVDPMKASKPTALSGGWIEHDGSRTCPIPEALDGEYEIRWTDGSIDRSGAAWEWRWHHDDDCQIQLVAYRLIPTEAA
jgi:hypothetical protein